MGLGERVHHRKAGSRPGRILFLLSVVLGLTMGMCFTASAAAKLTQKKLTLSQGETFRLRLKGASGEVEWDSTRPEIASVGEKGLVRALKAGRCKIRAVCGGKVYACRVIVQAIAFETPSLTMVQKRSQVLRFTSDKVSGAVWTSSAPKVAEVKDGVVTALRPGTTVITAKWNGISMNCQVTVVGNTVENLSLAYPASKTNRGKIVLAGSSSMDYWEDAQQAFAPYEVINTAIAGTTAVQWLGWFRPLITRYKPAAVVLYVGSNDLGDGTLISGEANAQNTILLLKKISRKLKNIPVFYVSINPCWARKGSWEKISISNQLVKSFCDRRKNLYYIDIVFAFTDAKGTPDKTLFLEDQLHPSKKGYAIWERLVADQVKKTARRSLRKALNSRKQTEKSEKNE